jgi:hypothetical protein
MLAYKKTEELAKEFDQAYPTELSARLEWWSQALGIDRVPFLRLLGMSARQASQFKSEDLKVVLERPEWEERAWLVEGRLHRLLSLFQYDWRTLAKRIHEPARSTAGEESAHLSRKGTVKHLTRPPNGDGSEMLINRIAEGGPQSLSDLLAYLAASQADAGRAGS